MAVLLIQAGLDVFALDTSVAGTLSVTGTDGLSPTGEEGGGSYLPSSLVYTLTNTGTTSINWTAAKTAAWVSLSSASGTLAAGASTTVTVSVVAATIDALADGAYSDTVTFTNTTNGNGDTTRSVNLTVTAADGDGGSEASEIVSYGTTLTMTGTFAVGQYVTGDWWIVDPGSGVPYTLSPTPTYATTTGRNGAMINPSGGAANAVQAADARGYSYSAAAGAPASGTLHAGDSLVCWISRPDGDSNQADLRGVSKTVSRNPVRSAVVFTVVSVAPSATAFRPPYCGTEKPTYDWADVLTLIGGDATLNPNVAAPSAPAYGQFDKVGKTVFQEYAEFLARVDPSLFMSGDQAEPICGIDNCCGYYREAHANYSDAMLACCVAVAGGDVAYRTSILQGLIQRGIDQHYAVKSYSAGLSSRGDRRLLDLLIQFAGIFLDEPEMYDPRGTGLIGGLAFGNGYNWFKTEKQIILGSAWTGADVIFTMDDLGTETHETTNPFGASNHAWDSVYIRSVYGWKAENYRRGTHSWCWVGAVLALRLIGRIAYVHSPLVKYIDRWMLYGAYASDDTNYATLAALYPPAIDPTQTILSYRQGRVPSAGGEDPTKSFVVKLWNANR